jgi:hypothetical protein
MIEDIFTLLLPQTVALTRALLSGPGAVRLVLSRRGVQAADAAQHAS